MTDTPIYDRLCLEHRIYPTLRDLVKLGPYTPQREEIVADRTWDDEYWWSRRRGRKGSGGVA